MAEDFGRLNFGETQLICCATWPKTPKQSKYRRHLMEQTKTPSQTGSKTTTDEEIAQLVAEARLIRSLKKHVESRPDLDSLGSQQPSGQDKKA
jgi:hypothetical protein